MKIYLDLVFFINFSFDFLLLLTVKIILKRNIELIRILFGSLIGALSIFLLFLRLNSFTLFLLKLIISILMIITTFGVKDREYFFKNFLYLYFVSIVLGGFLYFLNIEFSYKNVGLIFFHNGFSINFILLLILSPVILYFYIKQVKELRVQNSYHYTVEFTYNRKKYKYSAYLDTGNKLYDPYTHKPIIILYDKSINIKNPIYIPYSTVDNNGLLKAFKINKIVIDGKEINKKIIIALSNKPLNMDGVDMLLHKDYLS